MHKLKGHTKEVDDVTCHPDTHLVCNSLSLIFDEAVILGTTIITNFDGSIYEFDAELKFFHFNFFP